MIFKAATILSFLILLRTYCAQNELGCLEENLISHCFFDSEDKLNWSEAKQACSANGMNLAKPDSNLLDSFLRKYLNKVEENSTIGVEYSTWIRGIESPDTNWKWAWSDNYFQIPANDTRLSSNFSSLSKYFENCAVISKINETNAKFESQQCRRKYPFICQSPSIESNDSCVAPSMLVNGSCASIEIINEVLTWFEAVEKCASMNSRLAEFDPVALTNAYDNISIILTTSQRYWVGLTRQPWIWSDSHDINDANKMEKIERFGWMGEGQQPDLAINNCVAFYVSPIDVGWKADNCDSKRNYICQNSTRLLSRDLLQTTSSNKGKKSPIVIHVLPALLLLGTFILIVVLFFGGFAYKRKKGYSDIMK